MDRLSWGRWTARGRAWSPAAVAAAAVVGLTPGTAVAQSAPDTSAFACDRADGIWQPLDMDENHDNLFAELLTPTATAGEDLRFRLVWEWRDWRPGAELSFRHCLDIDTGTAVDGQATAPFDSLGTTVPDETVVHPTTEPTRTVMKDDAVRPAVAREFSVPVPASAPEGSEVCVRSAILPDEEAHLHSPPDFDISESVCTTVVAAETIPPAPPPPPSPSPSPMPPEASTENVATAPTPAPPAVAPQQTTQPGAEVLGIRVLPRTGVPLPVVLLGAAALLMAGGVALWRTPRPFVVFDTYRPRRRG